MVDISPHLTVILNIPLNVAVSLLLTLTSLLHTEDCLATLLAVELLVTLALPSHGKK